MDHKVSVLGVLILAVFGSYVQLAVAANSNFDLPPISCFIACSPPKVPSGACGCVDASIFLPTEPDCPSLNCPLRLIPCAVYKKDANGCPTCQCQCSRLNICPKGCLHGVERGLDAVGCPTCKCKPRPVCPP